MKRVLSFFVLWLVFGSCVGQVMFRNDITLGKHVKSRNKGITFISVSLGRSMGMPLVNRSNTLVIDVQALRNPHQTYTYQQLAERVYGIAPTIANIPDAHFPKFLLMEPPPLTIKAVPSVHMKSMHP